MTGEFVSGSAGRPAARLESDRLKAFEELCVRSWRRQLIEAATRTGQRATGEEKAG